MCFKPRTPVSSRWTKEIDPTQIVDSFHREDGGNILEILEVDDRAVADDRLVLLGWWSGTGGGGWGIGTGGRLVSPSVSELGTTSESEEEWSVESMAVDSAYSSIASVMSTMLTMFASVFGSSNGASVPLPLPRALPLPCFLPPCPRPLAVCERPPASRYSARPARRL